MLLVQMDQLTPEQKMHLEQIRKSTKALLADCFTIEELCTAGNIPQLKEEFFKARASIGEAEHQLLRQMGWRK